MIKGVREVLASILPVGLTIDMVDPIPRDEFSTLEALDPLGPLSSKTAARKLKPGTKVVPPVVYEELKKQQAAVRAVYSRSIDGLLQRAVSEGPQARGAILDAFQAVSRKVLGQSHSIGLRLTAGNPNVEDKTFGRYLDARAAHDRLHFADFLSAIWENREVLPRERRRDLYVNNLDAMFHQAAIAGAKDGVSIYWKLSPAVHCYDCIGLAANAPYSKPGTKSDLPPLPTVPRRGDCQCLANCKCYLTFIDKAGAPVDPGEKPGGTIVDEDGDGVDPESESAPAGAKPGVNVAAVQKEVDALYDEIQYDRAMYDQTGDKDWLKRRKDANDRLIQLQEETGLRFQPNAPAARTSEMVTDATKQGWEAATAADAEKFVPGKIVGVVKDLEFTQGTITKWNPRTGVGELDTLDGRKIEVGTSDDVKSIMLEKGLSKIPAKPWKLTVPRDGAEGVVTYDVPGRSNFVVEVPPPKWTKAPPDFSPTLENLSKTITPIPMIETHGISFWLASEATRTVPLRPDVRDAFGRRGVEVMLEDDVVALRGAWNDPAADYTHEILLGVGGRLYLEHVSGASAADWHRALTGVGPILERYAEPLVNGTTDMRAFAAAYYLANTNRALLAHEAPVVLSALETVLKRVKAEAIR